MQAVTHPYKLLIVDDEPDVLEVLMRRLELWGYEVCEAANGSEATARARTFEPDLVICDMMLPDKNGFEIWREIVAIGCKAPFLFLTGRMVSSPEGQEIRQAGNDFLLKPFDAPELQSKVEELIKNKGSRSEKTHE